MAMLARVCYEVVSRGEVANERRQAHELRTVYKVWCQRAKSVCSSLAEENKTQLTASSQQANTAYSNETLDRRLAIDSRRGRLTRDPHLPRRVSQLHQVWQAPHQRLATNASHSIQPTQRLASLLARGAMTPIKPQTNIVVFPDEYSCRSSRADVHVHFRGP